MKSLLTLLWLVGMTCLGFTQSQPNLIYIMVDDMGVGDLGCYGQDKIKTPSLDMMAEKACVLHSIIQAVPCVLHLAVFS